MLTSTRALRLLPVLFLVGPARATAQKLDKDDKQWLSEVRPIMLPDEERTYRGLKEKADRQEFQKIFWARRDPDLATPANEYEAEYKARWAQAERQFRVSGRGGAGTDCGRVFLLLGRPDEVRKEPMGENPGLRPPETWTYQSRPGQSFQGGKAVISFDSECASPPGVAAQLQPVAAARVVNPNLDYRLDKNGRLVKLADLLPKDTPARALLKQPREDFAVGVQTAFLKVSDGSTGLLGLVRGDAASLGGEGGEGKPLSLIVAASAVADDGREAGWTEQPVTAEVGTDGFFVASFKIPLKLGKYMLKAGALDPETGRGSLVSMPIEVPDFSRVETSPDGAVTKVPSVASLLILRDVQELPEGTSDPENAYAAFQVGRARLVPFFGRSFKRSDALSFFYQVYDLGVDGGTGKAAAIAALSILRDGKQPVAKAPEYRIEGPVGGSVVGPVSLEGYDPGKYVVQLKVTDKVAGKDVVAEVPFEVRP